MTATARPTTTATNTRITPEDARQLKATLSHDRWQIFEVIAALAKAHPDAGYNAEHGGGVGQIRGEHLEEAKQLAAEHVAARDAALAAAAAREAASKAEQTAAGRFARIRDAIKAGLRRTDHGEDASPEAYAQAKAAAEAEQEATALRAEGQKEATTAAKRITKAKADAVAAAKAELPGLLRRDELDQAVADARAAIDRVRALGAEHDEAIRQHGRAFAAAGFESRWGGPEDGTGIQDNGTLWIDGTGYGPGAVRTWLADIKNYVHEIR